MTSDGRHAVSYRKLEEIVRTHAWEFRLQVVRTLCAVVATTILVAHYLFS